MDKHGIGSSETRHTGVGEWRESCCEKRQRVSIQGWALGFGSERVYVWRGLGWLGGLVGQESGDGGGDGKGGEGGREQRSMGDNEWAEEFGSLKKKVIKSIKKASRIPEIYFARFFFVQTLSLSFFFLAAELSYIFPPSLYVSPTRPSCAPPPPRHPHPTEGGCPLVRDELRGMGRGGLTISVSHTERQGVDGGSMRVGVCVCVCVCVRGKPLNNEAK